jgi:hypothetical protein
VGSSPFSFTSEGEAVEGIFRTIGTVIENGVPETTLVKDDLA